MPTAVMKVFIYLQYEFSVFLFISGNAYLSYDCSFSYVARQFTVYNPGAYELLLASKREAVVISRGYR